MDMFSIHPYPENSSIPPSFEHPQSTAIGLADYDKLVALLGAAFDGTAQPGSSLPIVYGEYGLQTAIPQQKLGRYTGAEQATTKPIDEQAQATADTRTRSRSRPATRRCGCCSSSTSRTSRSSSGSRPASSTPTTHRNRAWSRSRARPSPPRRPPGVPVTRGTGVPARPNGRPGAPQAKGPGRRFTLDAARICGGASSRSRSRRCSPSALSRLTPSFPTEAPSRTSSTIASTTRSSSPPQC